VEALFYTKLDDKKCRCDLCPRGCEINPGGKGYCLSRENRDGKLISALYGKAAASNVDPIEKKPLYHFLPGTKIFSMGTIGCNLGCRYCQNWQLSRGKSPVQDATCEDVMEWAGQGNAGGIAYTYNEPLIWYEFVLDCAGLAHQKGLKNILVTNGVLNPEPFDKLLPYIDGMNIDLKGDSRFYKELTDSTIEPVLRNILEASKYTHVEITNLLVTDQNDSEEQIGELVEFISSINPAIPVHFSRYFPNYKFDAPPTSPDTFAKVYRIAREKLEFVYFGNIMAQKGQHTSCPNCKTMNIQRRGYEIEVLAVSRDGRCSKCGYDLNIVTS